VVVGRVQIGSLDIQRQPPAPAVVGDGGEADFGAILGKHALQPAGVVVHRDWPYTGQGHRPLPAVVTDPDSRWASLGVFVAQPKRQHSGGFLLEPREADPPALALA
jgi:hypothetical protein